jgi:hypothetical protein
MTRTSVSLRTAVAAILCALPAGAAGPPGAPALGTVTGTLTLDGTAIPLHNAVAVAYRNPFINANMFMVALAPGPIVADPRAGKTPMERLDQAVTTGITIDMDDTIHCASLVIRHPSLGGRRLAKVGFKVCDPGAIKIVDSTRVEGMVRSSPDGAEETISGHKVSYSLTFNAPVSQGAPSAHDHR